MISTGSGTQEAYDITESFYSIKCYRGFRKSNHKLTSCLHNMQACQTYLNGYF